MDTLEKRVWLGFYENELTNHLLAFWMPRCLDRVHGGYFNCFNNAGDTLLSHDKYTWSQGRFVWMFAKLASLRGNTFTRAQRAEFLAYARSGRDFLMKHCLIAENDWRCVFLLEETGAPKYVTGCTELDMSISADLFVVLGLARYAVVADDAEAWRFARNLYESMKARYASGKYFSLPYPLSDRFHSHALPMGQTVIACELVAGAKTWSPDYVTTLKADIRGYSDAVLDTFTDENGLIHEFVTSEDKFFANLFGQHINPGHSLEDVWFQADAADLLGEPERVTRLARIAKRTLETGWDAEFGGLFHFTNLTGGVLCGDPGDAADEAQMPLVMGDWGSKLWWVHSEALYTTLLLYARTGDADFLAWHKKVADYTFSVFPQPDPEIREWRQILTREGVPQDKVVALPVKDPFHIVRNVSLIIELLYGMLAQDERK